MRYVNFQSIPRNVNGNNTVTVQDFGHFLGRHPHSLGIAADLYPNHTAMQLLDKLMNVHEMPKNKDRYKSIKDGEFQWGINVTNVKKVKIAEDVTTSGVNQEDIVICLEENYFQYQETFVIDGSRDTLYVIAYPRQISTKKWQYTCKLVTSDINRSINLAYARRGNTTRFRSNALPELSEKRPSPKYHRNIEKHRNFLTLHGASKAISGQFAIQETAFIRHDSKKSNPVTGKEEIFTEYFKMEPVEKACYDYFMEARNNALLFGESNHNEEGKCLQQTPDGRDVPMGDGIITQFHRYAERHQFSRLTAGFVRDAIVALRQKSENPSGNRYVILCNEEFETMWHAAMVDELKTYDQPATAFYSKRAGKEIVLDAGNYIPTYSYLQNMVTIMVDRSLSHEYNDRAYGIIMDLTPDVTSGKPAIELFTLEGANMVTGTLKGLGGMDGQTSGDMASPIHGYQHDIIGYDGVAVYNPYRSVVMEQSTGVKYF